MMCAGKCGNTYRRFTLAFLTFLSACPLALADEMFTLTFESYPVAQQQCAATAQTFGDDFHSVTGLEVFSTTCQYHRESADITVYYFAPIPVRVNSTYSEFDYALDAGYQTRADCEAALARELVAYQQFVGADPFAHYCVNPREQFGSGPYFVKLDGINLTGMRPFSFAGLLDMPVNDPALFMNYITSVHLWPHFSVSNAELFFSAGTYSLGLRYYAMEEKSLDLETVAEMRDTTECARLVPELQTIINRGFFESLGVVCTGDMGRYGIKTLISKSTHVLQQDLVPQDYATLADCDAARSSVELTYRTRMGRAVLGSFCMQSGHVQRIKVISQVPRPVVVRP